MWIIHQDFLWSPISQICYSILAILQVSLLSPKIAKREMSEISLQTFLIILSDPLYSNKCIALAISYGITISDVSISKDFNKHNFKI